MEKDIKLIVSDIDCTLIDRDEILPADAPLFADEIRENGYLFSVATGRVETNALRFVKALGIDIPYVASNGAVISECTGHALVTKKFVLKGAREIVELAESAGLSVIYTIDGLEYVTDLNREYIQKYLHRFSRDDIERAITEEDYESLYIDKLSIMSSNDDETIAKLEKLCEGHEDFAYTRYQDRSVELVEKTATKESGVALLADMLGLAMDNVMFIGDHQNDISLIKAAGLGVAVQNATEDAKKAADYVASKPMFEGVREAVNKFILEKK